MEKVDASTLASQADMRVNQFTSASLKLGKPEGIILRALGIDGKCALQQIISGLQHGSQYQNASACRRSEQIWPPHKLSFAL